MRSLAEALNHRNAGSRHAKPNITYRLSCGFTGENGHGVTLCTFLE